MKNIKYAVILSTLLVACSTPSNDTVAEVVKSPREKAIVLRDSALIMSKNGNVEGSIALIDKAISIDPKSRKVILSGFNTQYINSTKNDVVNVLEIISGSDLKDPYSSLHLGVEYELLDKKELANNKYNEAVSLFIAVLDTMPITKELKRNTHLMNLALAVTLSDSDLNKQKLISVMSEAEKKDLEISLEALNNSSREKLLRIIKRN